jgi:hypothetical protein
MVLVGCGGDDNSSTNDPNSSNATETNASSSTEGNSSQSSNDSNTSNTTSEETNSSNDSNETNTSETNTSEANSSSESNTTDANTTDSSESNFTCPSTTQTDSEFNDTFVSNSINDIKFSQSEFLPLTVAQIAAVFNLARANDPTVSTDLQMPTQTQWNAMSASQRALYLLNSERCARGLIPFEGVEPKVITVAQNFANHIASTHNMAHQADGRTPWQRLEEDADVNTSAGGNADYFRYAENLAYQAVTSSTIYEPTAKSIYWWMYEDKGSAYGHRNFILAKGLVENSGNSDGEGLIGIGQKAAVYTASSGSVFNRVYTVLNAFDPNGSWDLSNIETVTIKE